MPDTPSSPATGASAPVETTMSRDTEPETYPETYRDVERALLERWPETRLEPSLDRIARLVDLIGDPQHAYPVIHLTGTNGKTSTSRMIDTLITAMGLRTGRFTSPHVESMTERISLDGEPMSEERFVSAYNDVAPYAALVDKAPGNTSGHPLSSRSGWVAPGTPRT